MLQVGSHWSRSTYQRVLVGSRAINTPHYLTTVPLARVAGGDHFYAVCARPDRASSRKITFTSPYAPVNGMPRKLTHERCLGHRRSSQSEELTTNGRRPSEGRVRRRKVYGESATAGWAARLGGGRYGDGRLRGGRVIRNSDGWLGGGKKYGNGRLGGGYGEGRLGGGRYNDGGFGGSRCGGGRLGGGWYGNKRRR